jgi:phosphopantetheine--protein transferase-like protein
MKNKIKDLHNKLSTTKIQTFNCVISTSSFSSILKDRFVSELKKMNVMWNLEPTTINKLTKKNNTSSNIVSENKIVTNKEKFDKNVNVGIDIQLINDLPKSVDPWEDQFYLDNFNKNEISHCLKKKNIYQSFAGIFALKEAIYKIDKSSKKDVKIKFSKDGKPLTDKYSISISHDNDYAIAVAVLSEKFIKNSDLEKLNFDIEDNRKSILTLEKKIPLKTNNKWIYFFMLLIIIYLITKEFLIKYFI